VSQSGEIVARGTIPCYQGSDSAKRDACEPTSVRRCPCDFPISVSLHTCRILEVLDKGKAASVTIAVETKDKASGKVIFENTSTLFIRGSGGFGGKTTGKGGFKSTLYYFSRTERSPIVTMQTVDPPLPQTRHRNVKRTLSSRRSHWSGKPHFTGKARLVFLLHAMVLTNLYGSFTASVETRTLFTLVWVSVSHALS
jgi:hypothetical protein